ncbi:hypothetical protein PQX77_002586 [Marasmius sp. AFHP31]|nr:hypothetical protein PQX77_002586 [Marasmius sp. AFHP31]
MTSKNAKRAILGHANPSPQKKRAKKDQEYLNLSIQASRLQTLQRTFDQLRGQPRKEPPAACLSPNTPPTSSTPPPPDSSDTGPTDSNMDMDLDNELPNTSDDLDDVLPPPSACSQPKPSKQDEEEGKARRWRETLKSLVDPLLQYWDRTLGVYPEEATPAPETLCSTGTCISEIATVQVIHFDNHRLKTFRHCRCKGLPQVLITHGLFPTSPSQPRMAISLELLEFYRSLSQHASDAVTALASGLTMVYRRRGFRLLGAAGEALSDPIRRALGNSLQWYDTLLVEIDRYLTQKVDAVKQNLPKLCSPVSSLPSPLAKSPAFALLPSADASVSATPVPSTPSTSGSAVSSTPTSTSDASTPHEEVLPASTGQTPPPTISSNPTSTSHAPTPHEDVPPASAGRAPPTPPSEGVCDPYLQRLCPACFGGTRYGQSFQWGGDIHVALDGNFHHRHLKSGGDGVPFHTSTRFLSKEFTDSVGERITSARARPPKHHNSPVPDDVVDSDRDAYKAARSENQKRSNDIYDENGVMALVCRHDIPLFMTSINTPGEQQKDAVALLLALFGMIPSQATVVALYDIACVLDRSIHLYDLLDTSIVERLQLATAVMHAYGHQWVCQLHYNPHMRIGLGITDGEGTERLWSRLRKVIGLERRASRAKRIWMLDRHCDSIALDLREGLGSWITRRLRKNVQKKEAEAVRTLRNIGTAPDILRQYWGEQKAAQSSIRALAPARLKKELAKVLQLQDQIDSLEEEITGVKSTVKRLPFPPADALFILRNLEELHRKLKAEAEGLYGTLNIGDQFPNLKNIPLEFLHNLLLARDLKVTIRKKAIGSFFEWDRLDQAVGGAGEALGTRAHQLTRNSISRRAAAFENQIRKFNQHVTYIEQHHRPSYRIPVPHKLPTQLAALRDLETSHLLEDVCVTQMEEPPKWLVDENARKGTRALLTLDRCAEERARLEAEAFNLCSWFRCELQALMLMRKDNRYAKYHTLLRMRLQDHVLLADGWANPFVPASVFRQQVKLVEQWLSQPAASTLRSEHVQCSSPPRPPSLSFPIPPPSSPPSSSYPSSSLPLSSPAPSYSSSSLPLSSPPPTYSSTLPSSPPQAPPSSAEAQSDDDDDEVEITGERLALDDVMDDCELDDGEEPIILRWEAPASLSVDATLLSGIKNQPFPKFDRRSYAPRLILQYVFEAPQYERLDCATRWLDDQCINGCAALLQRTLRVSDFECAVLSSFAVPELLRHGSRTETAWRLVRNTEYWTKGTWVLPIHDEALQHWALAVVRIEKEEIHIFDSFGSRSFVSGWLSKIQVVIGRLVNMAKDHGFVPPFPSLSVLPSWTAHPLQIGRIQRNGHDCGVWVLWVMAVVIRGYDYAYADEKDIVRVRKYLANLVRTITA